MAHDPLVGHLRPRQFGDDLAHQLDVVRAARPIVANGRRHAVGQILVDHGHGQQSPFALVDALRGFEHQVTMIAVHEFVAVVRRIVVADARHRIAVLPDRQFQQPHFGRRDDVGVVAVRHDLLHRNGPDAVNRTPVLPVRFRFVTTLHISP